MRYRIVTNRFLMASGWQMIKGPDAKASEPLYLLPYVVAGVGFEPTTSGL